MIGREHAIYSRHVLVPGTVMAGVVRLHDGRIAAVERADAAPPGAEDLGAWWLLPGLVDAHVHVNEPGRADWEGFATAGRAAAAGGVTTIMDMPLNAIPATTIGAALAWKEALAHASLVHVGFWGGLVPGNAGELRGLAAHGARGFKCFLVPSGVPEFEAVTESDILGVAEAMRAQMDYYAHGRDTTAIFEKLARLEPATLACMHGSAWRGDGAALLREQARLLEG